jgi:hypothetical protein
MPAWTKQRVLITVRTYPAPSAKSVEASCTAGITEKREWIRLFPIPYRLIANRRRFKKWQWIEVETLKASNDSRPESFKVNQDSIVPGNPVGTNDGWQERCSLMEPLKRSSLCRIQRERDEHGAPTLGFFKPFNIKRLIIEEAEQAEWTENQLAALKQGGDLFQKAPEQLLEKIPLEFRYEFRCGDVDCKGHNMICTDWEMIQAYRSWRREYGGKWEERFRHRFEAEMIHKNDTHFFVGTMHQYPKSWIVVGLFYPPPKVANLFN